MRWLHRLRHRLSLTRNEAAAMMALSGLFIIGILARHVQQRAVPVPVGAYDELDRLFFERSARADSAVGPEPGGRLHGSVPHADAPGLAAGDAARRGPLRAAPQEGGSAAGALRVDLNGADAGALEALPRIGPKTAERILAFRAAYGPFRAVEELQQVRGIGPKTLDLLRPHVYVSIGAGSVDTLGAPATAGSAASHD